MRVEILKLGAAPEGARHPKEIHEVSDEEGAALIADGAARELPPLPPPAAAGPTEAELEAAAITGSLEPPVETATAPPAAERATARGGKGRRGKPKG